LVVGSWQLAVGSWQLVAGGVQLASANVQAAARTAAAMTKQLVFLIFCSFEGLTVAYYYTTIL
jgi:hypothetical protein